MMNLNLELRSMCLALRSMLRNLKMKPSSVCSDSGSRRELLKVTRTELARPLISSSTTLFRVCFNDPMPTTCQPAGFTTRQFHSTSQVNHLMKLTRCRVVDNSIIGKQAMAQGKPPKIIHVYTKTGVGTIGDKVLVAILGEMKKAIIVGVKKNQRTFIPRCDSNNIVLIEENGTPLGTRIHVPIPIILRKILKEKTVAKGPDYSKLLALATRFI